MNKELTKREIEIALKVLEYMRDEYIADHCKQWKGQVNEVHYDVQCMEEDLEYREKLKRVNSPQ